MRSGLLYKAVAFTALALAFCIHYSAPFPFFTAPCDSGPDVPLLRVLSSSLLLVFTIFAVVFLCFFSSAMLRKKQPSHEQNRDFLVPHLFFFVGICIAVWMNVSPGSIFRLGQEDGPIEWLSALCLLASSAFTAVAAYKLYVSNKKYKLSAIAAGLGAVTFFVAGMEEVSWLQRVFNIETPLALKNINSQLELNIHNIHTTYFMTAYYFFVFTILILTPFLHLTTKIFEGRLRVFKILIADKSVMLSSAACFGLGGANFGCFKSQLFVMTTLSIMVFMVLRYPSKIHYMFLIMGYLFCITFTKLGNSEMANPWLFGEYSELFTTMAFLLYAAQIYRRSAVSKKTSR